MLKTLTKYFNTFANTGFGCLECSPARPDLPGAPGICTFQGFAGTRGALGTRPGVQHAAGWRNRGSSRSCCCLLSVQCKHQMWSGAKKQEQDLPWGAGVEVAETPDPPGGYCTPRAAGKHSGLCLAAQGPPALCPPLLLPGESLTPLPSGHGGVSVCAEQLQPGVGPQPH